MDSSIFQNMHKTDKKYYWLNKYFYYCSFCYHIANLCLNIAISLLFMRFWRERIFFSKICQFTGADGEKRKEEDLQSFTDGEIVTLIDNVMKNMDVDDNGFITYPEFIRGN